MLATTFFESHVIHHPMIYYYDHHQEHKVNALIAITPYTVIMCVPFPWGSKKIDPHTCYHNKSLQYLPSVAVGDQYLLLIQQIFGHLGFPYSKVWD